MQKDTMRNYCLSNDLSRIFDLKKNIDTALSFCMYNLNKVMDSDRSSIFLYHPTRQELVIYSSLDLTQGEIRIPISFGVAGWVFGHRKPAIVHNTYEDCRFYGGVDDMTGFYTRNLICAPLNDNNGNCLGTLQTLNNKGNHYTTNQLELLEYFARMVAVAIKNNSLYNELIVTNNARKKVITQILGTTGKVMNKPLAC